MSSEPGPRTPGTTAVAPWGPSQPAGHALSGELVGVSSVASELYYWGKNLHDWGKRAAAFERGAHGLAWKKGPNLGLELKTYLSLHLAQSLFCAVTGLSPCHLLPAWHAALMTTLTDGKQCHGKSKAQIIYNLPLA